MTTSDLKVMTREFPSKSGASTEPYVTRVNLESGEASCTCRGWTYSKRAVRGCTHTDEMLREVAAGNVTIEPKPQGPVTSIVLKPMLAMSMPEGSSIAQYSNALWCMEEKFDGHRLLILVDEKGTVTATSRPNGDRVAGLVRKLPTALHGVVSKFPPCLIDCELIAPDENGISRSWAVARADREKKLAVFDVLSAMGQGLMEQPYRVRRAALELIVAHGDSSDVFMPDSLPVTGISIEGIWAKGGEGAILKRIDSTYQPGRRSPDWVKVKRIVEEVVVVTGFEKGKDGLPYAVACFVGRDGVEGKTKVRTAAIRRQIAAAPESFIGRRLVLSFQGRSDTGSRRHPMFDRWADPEEG